MSHPRPSLERASAAAAWLPALLWGLLGHWLLASPANELPRGFSAGAFVNNLGHAVLVGGMGLLCLPGLALAGCRGRPAFRLAFLLALLWAVGEEWVQAGIPTRSPSLLDVVTGALGAILGLRLLRSLVFLGRPSAWELLPAAGAALSALVETRSGGAWLGGP